MSEDQRKQFWRSLTEANWEKAKAEIKSWEDIIEGDLDWDPKPAAAESSDQTFYQKRHSDLELINTINSERDFGIKAMRKAQSSDRIAELTNIFYDCLSKWESTASELNTNQQRIESAISRAQAMFAETSRLAQERVGRVQTARSLRAQQKAKEKATFRRIDDTNRESNTYIRGLHRETQRKAKKSRDRQHEIRMIVNLGVHGQCARCFNVKLVGHRYCYDCERDRLAFGWLY